MTLDQVLKRLHQLADPEKAAFKKAKYNIVSSNALGIYIKDLNTLAKEIGNDKELALKLFDTGLYDAQLLCSKMLRPKDITPALMEKWLPTFSTWEICDSFSMGLFSKTAYAAAKIVAWSSREREFEKRAGFATLASYTMADKNAANSVFESFYPLLINASTDNRFM